ncbi:DUF2294 family protein [Ornithinibacillus sp. BX22]|uniref:DUF2294 family protein n=2 Tax=Ornithinibacillus TaxID=484508 RepID=A0A923L847_9BACI|nr:MULTISPECIES: Na-translocating system protein MpsC family protein [Ornithinibacillus]MBC5638280.1 DUF2294 family protein [Ornithinibacillus hominis]MBS3680940.1 DUF2294 family protein [Ornithinibacillus massiliensis]
MERVHIEMQELNSSISKHLKHWYGKGPQTCYTTLHENKLVVHINKFITPSEKALLDNNDESLAYIFRTSVMDQICKSLQEEIYNSLGILFNNYFSDWDFATDTGIILFQNEHSDWKSENIDEPSQEHFISRINDVSSNLHRVPSLIEVVRFNKKLFAIKCHKVMLPVEKALYQKGHIDILHERAREIKKSYLDIGEVFGRQIKAVYMMWDYQNDQSYSFFYV